MFFSFCGVSMVFGGMSFFFIISFFIIIYGRRV
jgi:hypothetical protein